MTLNQLMLMILNVIMMQICIAMGVTLSFASFKVSAIFLIAMLAWWALT